MLTLTKKSQDSRISERVTEGPLVLTKKRSDDVVDKIVLERHKVVERLLRTDEDEPFSFKGREYLIDIYDSRDRRGGIMASRQAEKTTFLRNDIILDVIENKNDSIIYAASTMPVTANFSRNKFAQQFYYVDELKNAYIDQRCVRNVHERSYTSGTTVWFRAVGESVEGTRGITARKVVFDEAQSIQGENIPVIEEVAHHFSAEGTSEYRYTGTPLTEDNHFSKYWYNSMQVEWIITCRHCNQYQDPLGMQHIDEKKNYLFCQWCGKEIVASDGQWIPMNQEGEYKMYRICRLMTPNCRWVTPANDGVLDRLKSYSTQRFMNETMGLIFGSAGRPAPLSLLRQHCHDYVKLVDKPNKYWSQHLLVGAIDWALEGIEDDAESYTVFSIFGMVNNRMRPVYVKVYSGSEAGDPEYILEDIAGTANRFGSLKIIGCDYGAGHMENLRLAQMVNARLVEFFYTGNTEYPEWNQKRGRFYVNRSHSLEQIFILLRKGLFEFPPFVESKPYLQHIANEYQEATYRGRTEIQRYDHIGPDDFLHVLNYGKMTMEMVLGRKFLMTGF